MDTFPILVAGALAAGAGLMMLGGWRKMHRLKTADPLREIRHEQSQRAGSPQEINRAMELRLYDYGRSVEARIETQLELLDQLILDADREIARLEGILCESRFDWPTERPLSRTEQQRCFAMHEAGFTIEETARCLNTTPAAVQSALDEWRRPDTNAA